MTITEFIRQRLLARVITGPVGDKKETLQELRQSEWSDRFERYMRNRLLMGRFRYGAMHDPAKGDYDCVRAAQRHLQLYQDTGNLEHLVDAANMCLVEFEHSRHPNKHFQAIDDGQHAERLGDAPV